VLELSSRAILCTRKAGAFDLFELPYCRDAARYGALAFPSLGDVTDPSLKRRDSISEFGVGFPHDKHLDVVGLNPHSRPSFVNALFQDKKPAPPKSCPVCHETYQPQGKSSEEYVIKPPKTLAMRSG
jgi:hypothetical protein